MAAVLALLMQMVGGDSTHIVQPGDTLAGLGARFGVDIRTLAEANSLKPSAGLKSGQKLKIDNRHIAPLSDGDGIVVNVPQRMLYYFEQDQIACASPVAAGKADWKTPLGQFEIVQKEEQPTWDVPASIQEEMRQSGRAVLTHVPPSPENPLGDYWIGLSLPAIGIHGTNVPSSIYKLTTHGCIRLHPDDIEDLFSRVDVGTRGRIIYEPVLITRTAEGVFLEVHPDAYKLRGDPLERVLSVAKAEGFIDKLDLNVVKEVIRRRDGIARDVTRR